VGEPTPPDRSQTVVESWEEAASLISEALRVLDEVQGRLVHDQDLRWLVGMLMVHAVPGTMLPPRLAPLARECAERYVHDGGAARYTVATPVEQVRP
jgi:hypothetical protein